MLMNQHAYTRCVRLAAKAMTRVHVAAYRATRGRIGTTWLGGEVVFLATTGRRSGRRRIAPLVCIRDDSALAVVASNGGSDRTPDWWLNLQHDPRGEIECSGDSYPTWGTRADPESEARLLARFARTFPQFDGYRRRTTRDVPVVLLRPVTPTPIKRYASP
jgi:deazaflavin-dependent oxidoreductase (nitroreductase family)